MKKTKTKYYPKFLILLLSVVAIITISYKIAFSKTIREEVINKELKGKIKIYESLGDRILDLENNLEAKTFNREGTMESDSGKYETILDLISNYSKANPIRLIELPGEILEERDELTISTSQIVLQGSFRELLLLLEFIEKQEDAGKVCSTEFYLYSKNNSGLKTLRMRLFIVNLN